MAAAKAASDALREQMSPPGALNLPPLLEARRLEFGIPDGAFRTAPVYDRLYVFQIPRNLGATFQGTSIIRPDTTIARERRETPRGIIIGAGLQALDALKSHGMQVGDIVMFIRMAPWSVEVDSIGGHEYRVLVLSVGDIVGSEDLGQKLKTGEVRIEDKDGSHVYENKDGTYAAPVSPWRSSDY